MTLTNKMAKTALVLTLSISFSIQAEEPEFTQLEYAEQNHQHNYLQGTKHTPSTKLKWTKAPFGPDVAPVAGDFTSGEHITYVKFTAGMKTPIHIHSANYVGVVISGVSRHWEPGKPNTRKRLSAGSHWRVKANIPHISECLPGLECVFALYQKEAFDFIPLE